jgi:hypothetical protein
VTTVPDHRARLVALKAMLDAGDATRCPQVAQAIPQEPHPKVRAAMVMVLARLGGASYARVIAQLTEDPDVGVRLRAVEALASFYTADCAAALVRVLGHEPEARVRDVAAHFLMAGGRDELLALFREMLRSDKPWKREASVRACQMFNSPLVVPFLKHAAVEDGVESIRDSARAGLERLASEGNAAAAEAQIQIRALEQAPVASAPEPPVVDTKLDRNFAFADSYRGGKVRRVELENHLSEDTRPCPVCAHCNEKVGLADPGQARANTAVKGRKVFCFLGTCSFCKSTMFPWATEFEGRKYCGRACLLAVHSERGGFCDACFDASSSEDYGGCRSMNGIGTALGFDWLRCATCGSQIMTKWIVILFVPIAVVGCYRGFRLGGARYLTRRVPTKLEYYGRDLAVPFGAIAILWVLGFLFSL